MDPLENLRKLQERIYEVAAKLNLEVGGVALVPDRDADGRDVLNITFMLTAEAVESLEETETRKTDDAFESLMSGLDFGDLDLSEFDTDEQQAATAAENAADEERKQSLRDILKDFDADDL